MAKRRPEVVVGERGPAAVAWGIGTSHKVYEDRYRMLTADIAVVGRHPDRGEVFAVFDGIGGAPLGMRAAQAMADGLIEFYRQPKRYPATWEGLRQVLLDANEAVFGWGFIEGTDRPLGGCAGTVAWLRGGDLFVFQAGDTVGILLTEEGQETITRLHETAGGIFRYFGKGAELEIDVEHRRVKEWDRVLLASDGVTKVFDTAEMGAIVRDLPDPAEAAGELARRAQGKGSPDDITVMVVDCEI